MVKFVCDCLNVKIQVKNAEVHPVDVSQLGVDHPQTQEDFFNLEIAEVQLDLEGISTVHGCLVKQVEVDNWKISKCVNCNTYTHALHTNLGTTKVLINTTSLKSDPSIIERLQTSSCLIFF